MDDRCPQPRGHAGPAWINRRDPDQSLRRVGLVSPIFNTNLLALVQTVTPPRFLGRITGTSRFITWGVLPIGAALGGQIAGSFGLRAPILIAGSLSMAAFIVLATSHIRGLASVAAAARLAGRAGITDA